MTLLVVYCLLAGKEGLIKIWTSDFQMLSKHNVLVFSPRPLDSSCHALAVNSINTKLSVGELRQGCRT